MVSSSHSEKTVKKQPQSAQNTQRILGKNKIRTLHRNLQVAAWMRDRLNATTEQIIGAAIAVHRSLGPGLLESAYETCLELELLKRRLIVERQKPLPLEYGGKKIDCAYRLDLLVNDDDVVEMKSVERVTHVHKAQILSYLRLADKRVGLLINFNVKWLVEEGVHRLVNEFPDWYPTHVPSPSDCDR